MKRYKVFLIQKFGRKIKYAVGSTSQVLREVSSTIDDMPVNESIVFEFVRFE